MKKVDLAEQAKLESELELLVKKIENGSNWISSKIIFGASVATVFIINIMIWMMLI